MKEYTHVIHDLAPVYNEHSKILVLGSLPSVKSRGHFFYNHPRNRFWKVISAVTGRPVPEQIPEKKCLLLESGIALWDVIRECDIIGSSDSSIRNAVPNVIRPILEESRIRAVFTNGAAADRLYRRYLQPLTGRPSVLLPSTSPANASWDLERLTACWCKEIGPYLA